MVGWGGERASARARARAARPGRTPSPPPPRPLTRHAVSHARSCSLPPSLPLTIPLSLPLSPCSACVAQSPHRHRPLRQGRLGEMGEREGGGERRERWRGGAREKIADRGERAGGRGGGDGGARAPGCGGGGHRASHSHEPPLPFFHRRNWTWTKSSGPRTW